MSRKIFNFRRWVTVMSGAALLSLLSGCVGDMPRRGGWVAAPQNKRVMQLQPPMSLPPVVHSASVPVVPVAVKVIPASPAKAKPITKKPHSSGKFTTKRQP